MRVRRLLLAGLLPTIVAVVVSAAAAANAVLPSNVGQASLAITANDLKPSQCAALNLTAVLSGSGTITGTGGSELILGGAGNDRITGAGNDCIMGGGGNNRLQAGIGTSVLIGGPGRNTFVGGSGTTYCYANGGQATFNNCTYTFP